MLDVVFLREPVTDERAIVYVYRSGALRSQFKKAIDQYCETVSEATAGRELPLARGAYAPQEIKSSHPPNGWMPVYHYCEWPRGRRAVPGQTIEDIGGILASGEARRLALVLPHTCELLQHRAWATIKRKCCVIEEALITSKTLPDYLRYFDETTDLAPPGSFVHQKSFMAHFDGIGESGGITAGDLLRRFDEIVLTKTRGRSNIVSPPDPQDSLERAAGPALLRILRSLIVEQDRKRLIDLARDMGRRREEGFSCEERHVELYRRGAALLVQPTESKPTADKKRGSGVLRSPDGEAEYLWCAVFLAWDERLRSSTSRGALTPEMFGLEVDQMAREYLRRAESKVSDPLDYLWPQIRKTMQRAIDEPGYGLPLARARLVRRMGAQNARPKNVGSAWARRLNELAGEAVQAFADAEA